MTDEHHPPTASAPPRTEAPETRRSAYAFPIYACERCWHGESELTIHNKVLTACPKCGGTMREVGVPVTDAPQPCDLLCLVCARVKPWGIWDQTSGVAVCVECRDKARTPSPSADTGGAAETPLKADLDGRDHYERALGYIRDDGFATSAHWIEEHVASLRARLAESDRIITSYRGMLAAKLGYTLIPEDTVVRPDAMSYVKPSEFDRMAAALTREPTP